MDLYRENTKLSIQALDVCNTDCEQRTVRGKRKDRECDKSSTPFP
ncbi:hypothetical protein J2Y49_006298 [Azospirillum sp. BE72]|nr:hypothetical protein [Azospirillum sp. BE72]